MKVRFSGEAETDLERIGDAIAADNPERAITFIQEIRAKCRALADFPLSAPLVPRFEAHGVRRAVHGNYLVFYRLADDCIDIIHVLHGAMNYEPLLFEDGD